MAEIDLYDLPRTRKEAIERGIKRYFSGKPCPNGHVSARFVSSYNCVDCADDRSKVFRKDNPSYDRNWRRDNKNKVIQSSRIWRSKNIQKARENGRDRRYRNVEKAREQTRIWRTNNPEKILNWKRSNHEKIMVHDRNRRSRKHDAEGHHTESDIVRIRKSQRDKCGYCGIKLNGGGHVDHIIALSKGGANRSSNLQLLCAPCNLSKSARDPIEFAQSIGKLI
jgi:5-methylcytosine-specific restriction endonuclease McrA